MPKLYEYSRLIEIEKAEYLFNSIKINLVT